MKFRSLLASALLATTATATFADDVNVILPNPVPSFAFFNSVGTVFDGMDGKDDITFSGLDPGTYTLDVELSGQGVSFNAMLSNLSGTLGTLVGNVLHFSVSHTGSQNPFVLQLFGTDTNGSGLSLYNGQVTAAIPEPETYALMLAGLGLMGFIARRRRPQR